MIFMLFLGAVVFIGSAALMLALFGKTAKDAVLETEKDVEENRR
jgi:hypothetical protein